MESINEKKEERTSVQVRTLNNGYGLDVNGEGYMYFDIPSLLNGMLVHVGMERVDEMTEKEIKKYIRATKNGTVAKKLQKEVNVLKAENHDQKKQIRELKAEIKKLKEEKYY